MGEEATFPLLSLLINFVSSASCICCVRTHALGGKVFRMFDSVFCLLLSMLVFDAARRPSDDYLWIFCCTGCILMTSWDRFSTGRASAAVMACCLFSTLPVDLRMISSIEIIFSIFLLHWVHSHDVLESLLQNVSKCSDHGILCHDSRGKHNAFLSVDGWYVLAKLTASYMYSQGSGWD